jgi:hypothetical protein
MPPQQDHREPEIMNVILKITKIHHSVQKFGRGGYKSAFFRLKQKFFLMTKLKNKTLNRPVGLSCKSV